MKTRNPSFWLLLAGLALTLTQCGGDAGRNEKLQGEIEELRAELERLRQENRQLRGQPDTASEVYAHFAQDTDRGTLAGLVPGDTLAQARSRFGQENRTRSWSSEGQLITQHEWELEGGVIIRANSDPDEQLRKIAVAFTDPASVNLPTLAGLTLGQETFTSVQQKFGDNVTTDLQLWGAQGLYTVAQRAPFPNSSWRLEFLYEMPTGLGPGQLDRIEEEVMRKRNPAVLLPYLGDRPPYMVGLEEAR
jgi:hypothetical protein